VCIRSLGKREARTQDSRKLSPAFPGCGLWPYPGYLLTQHKRGRALDRFHAWALEVAHRRGYNKAAVAVANKLARRLWAMTRDGKPFDGDHLSAAPVMR
jgi:hypothetical protein